MSKSAIIGLCAVDSKVTISRAVLEKISLQSEVMLASAGNDKCVTAIRHGKTGRWHGILMINHPTPSGNVRWIRVFSDKRGYANQTIAIEHFRRSLSKTVRN